MVNGVAERPTGALSSLFFFFLRKLPPLSSSSSPPFSTCPFDFSLPRFFILFYPFSLVSLFYDDSSWLNARRTDGRRRQLYLASSSSSSFSSRWWRYRINAKCRFIIEPAGRLYRVYAASLDLNYTLTFSFTTLAWVHRSVHLLNVSGSYKRFLSPPPVSFEHQSILVLVYFIVHQKDSMPLLLLLLLFLLFLGKEVVIQFW